MTDKTNINEGDKNNEDEKRELTDREKQRELEKLFADFLEVLFDEDKKANGEIEEEESEEDSEEENKE